MTSKTTRNVIAEAMPKARVFESTEGFGGGYVLVADAATPSTEEFVRKYSNVGLVRSGAHSRRQVATKAKESVEAAIIDVGDVGLDAGGFQTRRVLLVDRKKKTIIGASG